VSGVPRSDSGLPPEVDTSRPHPARIYDYGLGGKNHFAVDREVAEKAWAAMPTGRTAARENRAFLGRVVRYLAAEEGIRWACSDAGTSDAQRPPPRGAEERPAGKLDILVSTSGREPHAEGAPC